MIEAGKQGNCLHMSRLGIGCCEFVDTYTSILVVSEVYGAYCYLCIVIVYNNICNASKPMGFNVYFTQIYRYR